MSEFDRYASDYQRVLDASVGSAPYFADLKARWLADRQGAAFAGRVLDYGCGVGLLAQALAGRLPHARIDGFDVSVDSLAAVPQPLRDAGQFTADATALRTDYDAIVVANVLHHVPRQARTGLIRDLVTRLGRGGKLVVFEHNPLNPATRWVVAHCAFDGDAVLLWPSETRSLLVQAGLCEVGTDAIGFFPPALAKLQGLEKHLRNLPVGAQYAAVGIKP